MGGQATGKGIYASRVLNTLQGGVVLLCAGIGILIAGDFGGEADFRNFMKAAGCILIAVGIGLAISAGWSFLLLKKWGFLSENATPEN
jgi:hypothetical protein